jgi:hypothetical protein
MPTTGAARIFLRSCGNRGHVAMLALAAQPAEKRALEQLRVDAIRLRGT